MNDEIKKKTGEIDHSIDVRYEPDVIKAFNKFIEKWCGNYVGHLLDDDENDGQFMREKIAEMVEGELKEFVEYTNDPKRASGTLRYHLKQYLLERKVN